MMLTKHADKVAAILNFLQNEEAQWLIVVDGESTGKTSAYVEALQAYQKMADVELGTDTITVWNHGETLRVSHRGTNTFNEPRCVVMRFEMDHMVHAIEKECSTIVLEFGPDPEFLTFH